MTAALYVTKPEIPKQERFVRTEIGGFVQWFSIDAIGGATPTTVSQAVSEVWTHIETVSLTSPTFKHDEFESAKTLIGMQQEGIRKIAAKLDIKAITDGSRENRLNQSTLEFEDFINFTLWVEENRGRTELDLEGRGLSHLPPQIGLLSKLTLLNLKGNNLERLPPELANLTHLQQFYLDDNPLAECPDLTSFKELCEVKLNRTTLATFPRDLDALPCLKRVELRENFLTEVPDWVRARPELADLDGNTELFP